MVFVHLHKNQRSKLDPCVVKCLFLGYGLNKKGYKCFDPICRTRHRGGLKNFYGKEQISGILFFDGKISCLRSRHLILRSLGTLTDQQRFYGTGLVVAREGISTPSAPYLR